MAESDYSLGKLSSETVVFHNPHGKEFNKVNRYIVLDVLL